MATAVKIRRSG